MQGNPTGAMGVADYLGWNYRSKAGLPIINVPGCPVQPDNFMETLLYLLYQAAGIAPMIPLDDQLRPTWLFGKTVHEGCDRAGYYEQGDFAHEYGSPKCLVKIGCWGPVVNCNVTKRGWMAGIGGCPNVGGICIGCTMPGFPDKFMPFMDEPPGGSISSMAVGRVRPVIRNLRRITNHTINQEPKWRHPGSRLTTGYHPTTYHAFELQRSLTHDHRHVLPHTQLQPSDTGKSQARRDVVGSRSPASSAAWASIPKSISTPRKWPSVTAPRPSSAATASS